MYVKSQDNHLQQQQQRDGRKLCTRGLESFIEGRSTQKDVARDCVLAVQELVREEGRLDDESMALMYKSQSVDSAMIARERAMEDAEAVAQYLGR